MFFLIIALLGGWKHGSASQSELVSICLIQGRDFSSPYAGNSILARGIVHTDLDETWKRGFFMQDENCDEDPTTSDGIFVYLGDNDGVVDSGDYVEVSGTVQEYYGLTELNVSPEDVTVLSSGNPLPSELDLAPPFNNDASRVYFESVEGMFVKVDQALTVGPTNYSYPYSYRSWLVRSDLRIERVFQDDPMGTGEIICVEDNGLYKISPDVSVGDGVEGLVGVLDYSYGVYCMQLVEEPVINTSPLDNLFQEPMRVEDERLFQFDVSSLNLWNLFDTEDDLNTEDSVLGSAEYHRRLQKRALAIHDELGEPDIIAVQEVENQSVLQDLVNRDEIETEYGFLWEDGPDRRGLDIALLYDVDRVQIIDYEIQQGCTSLVDGLGPDGKHDVTHPENEFTCDVDGDGEFDGNRLFSRPPLVVHLRICLASCQEEPVENSDTYSDSIEIWMLVNHWKSKSEDTIDIKYTSARRDKQSQYIVSLVEEILTSRPNANVIVLGDLNDYLDSDPVLNLAAHNLSNLLERVEKPSRYTYIYQGVSQVLDHVLVRLEPGVVPIEIIPSHINSDFSIAYKSMNDTAHRSSDHDPVLVQFVFNGHLTFMPLIYNYR
jgi:predicted extracellular nuclease